jgi:hypothetical protein
MPQARDEAGNIWEIDAAGNAIRLVQQAPRASAGMAAFGAPDPAKPLEIQNKQLDIRTKEAGLGNDAERLRLAREDQELQRQAAARAAEKDARDKQTLAARGGAETTEAERTAAFLATRVAGGMRDLKAIGNLGAPSLKDATVGGTLLGNYTTGENRQRTINAQRDVLDAALTLGTGAAYTQEQIDAYRASYFPQPGDQPGTIADKQRRLQTLMSAARVKAGAASSQIDAALEGSGIGGESASANPLSNDQQKLYDAYLASNPQATAEQLRTFAQTAGLGDVSNADEIIKARQNGSGVASASSAIAGQAQPQGSYQDSILSQGISGINEGIASTLGAPVDIVNSAIGLGAKGINAIANTNLSAAENPFLGGEWWRDKFNDINAIAPANEEGASPFVRRVGQSVGSALIPGMGTARTGGQVAAALASGLGGGLGAATAQQVAPGNALAEMGGELAGGGLTGLASIANGRRLAQREIEAAVPTVPQLKEQAGGLYRQAEQNGVTASPQQTQDIADRLGGILRQEGTVSPTGRVSEVHPKVREAYATAQDYAGSPMNPKQMQTVRGILSDGRMSAEPAEARIANLLTSEFDDWTAPLAPELAQARDVSSRYLSAQTLEKARSLAEARAGQYSQSGMENALRTEYRGIDRQAIKGRQPGLRDPVVEAVENVARGTTGSNVARALGRFAPKGPVSAGIATGVPFAIGNAMGGPVVGGAMSAATIALGTGGRAIASHLADRGANLAELIARNGGGLPQAAYLNPDIARLLVAQSASQAAPYLDDEAKNGY